MPLARRIRFGEDVSDWGNVMAGTAPTTPPTLLPFSRPRRYMVSGLAAGSVKQ